jgi:hypothetical protein
MADAYVPPDDDSSVLAALRELRSSHPSLRITRELMDESSRVWVARGSHGDPYLVLSDDLDRFRRAL